MTAHLPTDPESQASEDRVLAESALLGERAVSVVRLGVIAAQLLLFAPFEHARRASPLSLVGELLIAGYALFAVGLFFSLKRSLSNPTRAAWAPLVFNLVDYGYIVGMGWAVVVSRPEMARAAILCALVLSYSVARFRLWQVGQSAVMACASYAAVNLHAHASLTTMVFVLIAYLGLGGLIGWANRRLRMIFVDLRRRERLIRFLPAEVAEKALSLRDDALAPVQREVTVMFVDIRGFTSFSESLPPREVLSFLESFFRPITTAVRAHGGVVNKFLGDGILAIWGVPDGDERHAERAVGAALQIRLLLEQFNGERRLLGLPNVEVGIGIHSGSVAAGMLAGGVLQEYAVIGDAVNVASRIEGLTKVLAVDALVSEATWHRLPDALRGKRIAAKRVKGRHELVVVYALDPLALTGEDGTPPGQVAPESEVH